jgi:hypothetical protein
MDHDEDFLAHIRQICLAHAEMPERAPHQRRRVFEQLGEALGISGWRSRRVRDRWVGKGNGGAQWQLDHDEAWSPESIPTPAVQKGPEC